MDAVPHYLDSVAREIIWSSFSATHWWHGVEFGGSVHDVVTVCGDVVSGSSEDTVDGIAPLL